MQSKKVPSKNEVLNELIFEIKKYDYRFGHSHEAIWGAVKIRYQYLICCHGEKGEKLYLYFLSPDSPNPSPKSIVEKNTGAIFLGASEVMPYLELLKNHKPLFAAIHFDNPEWNSIGSIDESLHEIVDHYEKAPHLFA